MHTTTETVFAHLPKYQLQRSFSSLPKDRPVDSGAITLYITISPKALRGATCVFPSRRHMQHVAHNDNKHHSQLAKMSFDNILNLTAAVTECNYNLVKIGYPLFGIVV